MGRLKRVGELGVREGRLCEKAGCVGRLTV